MSDLMTACAQGRLEDAQAIWDSIRNPDLLSELTLAFQLACQHGHLPVAQWLSSVEPRIDILADDSHVLQVACEGNHVAVVIWLIAAVSPYSGGSGLSDYDTQRIMAWACEQGHDHVVQHLLDANEPIHVFEDNLPGMNHGQFRSRSQENLDRWVPQRYTRVGSSQSVRLQAALQAGDYKVVEQLWRDFGRCRKYPNLQPIFVRVCRNGDLRAAQWLWSVRRLQQPASNISIDLSEDDYRVFRRACKDGYLHIAQWLWYVDPKITVSAREDGFFWACVNGHMDTAMWLWSLGEIDLHRDQERAFRWACRNDQVVIAIWLWMLDGQIDVHAKRGYALRHAVRQNLDQVVEFLTECILVNPNLQCIETDLNYFVIGIECTKHATYIDDVPFSSVYPPDPAELQMVSDQHRLQSSTDQ